jgi:methylated-DNA-[protein]-cysteine S-methyltransferase
MARTVTTYTCAHVTPLGALRLHVDERGRLLRIDFPGPRALEDDPDAGEARCRHVARQLDEYFAGERTLFELDVAPEGTPFQLAAWRELQRIPFGATISYGEQARRMGKPGAVRAVGAANGRNPIPIVIPCHRVVGANGSLTGYGGGIEKKELLLALEAGGDSPAPRSGRQRSAR